MRIGELTTVVVPVAAGPQVNKKKNVSSALAEPLHSIHRAKSAGADDSVKQLLLSILLV